MYQTEIGSKTKVVEWARKCRHVEFGTMIVKKTPIGGPAIVVEIVELLFGHNKYHRGRYFKVQRSDRMNIEKMFYCSGCKKKQEDFI
jgi:hypothetical protein